MVALEHNMSQEANTFMFLHNNVAASASSQIFRINSWVLTECNILKVTSLE